MASVRSRPWRTMLVAAFTVLLVVQGFFSFRISPEPYPSIRMPSFGSAASSDGTVAVTFVEIESERADGSVASISAADLMSGFRFSMAKPSLTYMFHTDKGVKVSDQVLSWLGARIEALDGVPAESVRMCWRQAAVSVYDASVVDEGSCEWVEFAL